MARKSKGSGTVTIIMAVIVIALISAAIDFIKENWEAFAVIGVIIVGVIAMVLSRRRRARLQAEYARQEALERKANAVKKPPVSAPTYTPSYTPSYTPDPEPVKEEPKVEPKPDETPEKQVVEFHLPDTIDGATVAYQYEEVVFALDCAEDPDLYMAKELHFEKTSDKIHVKHEAVQIGSLKPGKITDMIRDWLERGDPIRAFLTGYNTDESTGYFIIVFYRDALNHAKRRGAAVKEYKLTGNKSAAAQEECCYASVNDRCTIEYDYDKEKYAVHDETYSLYGYLPAAGAKFYEEHDSNCLAVVSNVELDDEDRTVIYIALYAQ